MIENILWHRLWTFFFSRGAVSSACCLPLLTFHVTAPVGLAQKVTWPAALPDAKVAGQDASFSHHPFHIFLSPYPYPPHFVMTAITMTATLKVKELDLSPGDAEATPTQVCKGLYLQHTAFTSMLCKGIITDDNPLLRAIVKKVLDIKANLSLLSPWFYPSTVAGSQWAYPLSGSHPVTGYLICVTGLSVVCSAHAGWFVGLVHSFRVKLPLHDDTESVFQTLFGIFANKQTKNSEH